MTDKIDFKAALESYETDVIGNNEFGYMNWVQDNSETIQTALRLADRLQSGEVSEGMKDRLDIEVKFMDGEPLTYKQMFKAMAAQMMKEINDD